jgi:flagellar basal-body rod modification protein FlgD
MIDPLLATTLNGTIPTPAASPNDQITQQQFLTLFIAQLQNQDPLAPLEPEQLTAQLAQLSSLEQLTAINDRLDALTAATVGSQATTALGLIGRTVDVETSQLAIEGGVVPELSYTLGTAAPVTISVLDKNGKTVRTIEAAPGATGTHAIAFDGKDDAGNTLADGTYTIRASAKIDGVATPIAVMLRGRVVGANLAGNPPTIDVNGLDVPLDRVRGVHETAPTT